jgi:hypothetical protein
MIYKDYLNSARKHQYTCEVIRARLFNNISNNGLRKSLLLNLYYLSGYIIECIVKYAIYDLLSYKRDQDVKLLNQDGLTFDSHIKHHRFDIYTEHLVRRISSPIPLVNYTKNIDKTVVQLYKKWDVNIRYKYDLDANAEEDYIKFYEYSRQIFRLVKNNVRG